MEDRTNSSQSGCRSVGRQAVVFIACQIRLFTYSFRFQSRMYIFTIFSYDLKSLFSFWVEWYLASIGWLWISLNSFHLSFGEEWKFCNEVYFFLWFVADRNFVKYYRKSKKKYRNYVDTPVNFTDGLTDIVFHFKINRLD